MKPHHSKTVLRSDVRLRELWAWAMYDFANSGYTTVVITALLYFSQPETLWLAIVCVIASNFFFGRGENLIAAFLPEIAQVRAMGRVSGWGWSLGYIGGLLTLSLYLLYFT